MDIVKIDKKSLFERIFRKIKLLHVIIIILGGVLGYLFYYYTNCCADEMIIKINPFISVVYGLIAGGLISYKGR
jgi:hypothetical protein